MLSGRFQLKMYTILHRLGLLVFLGLMAASPASMINATLAAQDEALLNQDLQEAKELLAKILTPNKKEEYCQALESAAALFVFPKLEVGGWIFFKSVNGRGFILLPGNYMRPPKSSSVSSALPRRWVLATHEKYTEDGPGINLGYSERYCIKAVYRDGIDKLLREEEDNLTEIRKFIVGEANIFLTSEFGPIVGPVDLTFPSPGDEVDLSCPARFGLQLDGFAVARPNFEPLRYLGSEQQVISAIVNDYCEVTQ